MCKGSDAVHAALLSTQSNPNDIDEFTEFEKHRYFFFHLSA